MSVGCNSSLAGVLALIDLNFEVLIFDISDEKSVKENKSIFLNKDNCANLIATYKEQNKKFSDHYYQNYNSYKFELRVKDFLQNLDYKETNFSDIDFVYQRLEPMKEPFPPIGKISIDDYLKSFSENIFTKNKKYNLPINCFSDKELPMEIKGDLAIETQTSFVQDYDLFNKIQEIKSSKIVFKPDNSAQSAGVFAVEFLQDGAMLLENIINLNILDLTSTQLYKINKNQSKKDIIKILNILFFIQNIKARNVQGYGFDNSKIANLPDNLILKGAKSLYNDKILIQPFLQGVKIGDIRVNLLKIVDKFKIAGMVMRRSFEKEDNFTTGVGSGGSRAMRIKDVLNSDEISDLCQKINLFISQINSALKEKYQNIYEIGLDFILLGDKKSVFLAEANHHCQALIPFVEALQENLLSEYFSEDIKIDVEYDGGLAVMKEFFIQNFR